MTEFEIAVLEEIKRVTQTWDEVGEAAKKLFETLETELGDLSIHTTTISNAIDRFFSKEKYE